MLPCQLGSSILLMSITVYAITRLNIFGLVGKFYEKVCEACHITLNKIAIFGDNGTITPGGVRIGK